MPSRKWHTKTRNGCLACKKRRVRCNLTTPQCSHCSRRGEPCHYPTWDPPNPTAMQVARHLYPQTCKAPPRCNLHQLDWPSLWPSPAVLLSSTFAVGPNSTHWDALLTAQVGRHAALQSALRALTVLYQERFRPGLRRRPCIEAYTNHLEASREFSSLLEAEACAETKPVSIVIFTMAAGVFQLRTDALQGRSRSSAEVMRSFRATALLIQAVLPLFLMVQQSGGGGLAGGGEKERQTLAVALDAETFEGFDKLHRKVDGMGDGEGRKAVLQEATHAMSGWLMTTRGHPTTWTDFAIWPAGISEQFLDLLAEKDETASRMFGFWCQVMKRAPYTWFMNDWPDQKA